MEENEISESNKDNISYNKIISNEKSNDNEEEKEEINQKDEIKLFYDSLTDLLCKKQYKKILKLFSFKEEDEKKGKRKNEEEKEEKDGIIINESEWILPYIETISIQKIIGKKNIRYFKSPKVPKFNEYIEKENNTINKWLLFINELIKENKKKENIQSFLEFIITFILQKCINISKHCIYQKNFKEAICFLSLGINLINHSSTFFKSPETFFLCAETFLFLSSLLIGDNNYESAKNIINLSCKFIYICMETILFSNPNCLSYSIFNILDQEKKNVDIVNKLFFYLSLSFYHLGICYENQGLPYPSFYAYKQSKFFASIVKDRSPDINRFYEFIKEIEKRQLLRNRIIIFFEKFVKKEDLIDKEPPVKKEYNDFNSHREMKIKKFKILENYISKMKLLDVDNDEPHLLDKINKHFKYNVSLATKQIHLLDYLMSDNFKETIKRMNNIRINKLDKETINIIQKKIISIKNNEREKLSLKIKKEKVKNDNNKSTEKIIKEKEQNNFKTIRTASSAKTYTSGKKTRVSSSYKNSKVLMTDVIGNNSLKTESCFTFNSRPTTAHNELSHKSKWHGYFSLKNISKRNKILMDQKNNSDKNYFNKRNKLVLSNSTKSVRNEKLKLKYKIPKYSYDNYLFNKSFMKKRKILDNQYSNELMFQKQLLKSKQHEYIETNPFNLKQVQKECEKFYFRTFEKELMFAKERNIIFGKKEKNTSIKKKEKSSNTFLSTKKIKKIKINDFINDKSEFDFENSNKNNIEYIDKLFGDIVYLTQKEKILENRYGKSK